MIRGIRFKLPNVYDSFINKILNGINKDKYIWKIDEDQVFINGGDFLFSTDIYNGQDFKRIISHPSYYTVFINLRAYPIGTVFDEVKDYNVFLKSNCELIVLITDSTFVDIYSKNRADIEMINLNAQKNNFTEIEYITDENDKRKEFEAI